MENIYSTPPTCHNASHLCFTQREINKLSYVDYKCLTSLLCCCNPLPLTEPLHYRLMLHVTPYVQVALSENHHCLHWVTVCSRVIIWQCCFLSSRSTIDKSPAIYILVTQDLVLKWDEVKKLLTTHSNFRVNSEKRGLCWKCWQCHISQMTVASQIADTFAINAWLARKLFVLKSEEC